MVGKFAVVNEIAATEGAQSEERHQAHAILRREAHRVVISTAGDLPVREPLLPQHADSRPSFGGGDELAEDGRLLAMPAAELRPIGRFRRAADEQPTACLIAGAGAVHHRDGSCGDSG